MGRHCREGAAPRRRRVFYRSLRRPSLLLPSSAGANRAARPRQRLLRAVVQPEGHLVRRRHGGRRRGEERVEPGSARRRVRTRVCKNFGGGGEAAGPHERVLRPLSHRAVAQRSVVADPPAALFEPFADSLPEGDGSVQPGSRGCRPVGRARRRDVPRRRQADAPRAGRRAASRRHLARRGRAKGRVRVVRAALRTRRRAPAVPGRGSGHSAQNGRAAPCARFAKKGSGSPGVRPVGREPGGSDGGRGPRGRPAGGARGRHVGTVRVPAFIGRGIETAGWGTETAAVSRDASASARARARPDVPDTPRVRDRVARRVRR